MYKGLTVNTAWGSPLSESEQESLTPAYVECNFKQREIATGIINKHEDVIGPSIDFYDDTMTADNFLVYLWSKLDRESLSQLNELVPRRLTKKEVDLICNSKGKIVEKPYPEENIDSWCGAPVGGVDEDIFTHFEALVDDFSERKAADYLLLKGETDTAVNIAKIKKLVEETKLEMNVELKKLAKRFMRHDKAVYGLCKLQWVPWGEGNMVKASKRLEKIQARIENQRKAEMPRETVSYTPVISYHEEMNANEPKPQSPEEKQWAQGKLFQEPCKKHSKKRCLTCRR